MAGGTTIREFVNRFLYENDRAGMRAAESQANKLYADLERRAARFSDITRGAISTAIGLGIGRLVSGAQSAVGGVIESVSAADRSIASLQTTEGSVEAARAAFERLAQFATETPFVMQESVDAFLRLKNLGLDPSERAMRSYGNTASSMGKSLNDMIEAVADASTGEFERLKEFGIKSRKEGDRVVFTFQGLETEVGNSANEIQEYLLGLGENQFAGAMARQMDTLPGRFSNLQDAAGAFARAMGEGGLTDGLSEVVMFLASWLRGNEDLATKIGRFTRVGLRAFARGAQITADAIEFVAGGVNRVATAMGGWQRIIAVLTAVLTVLAVHTIRTMLVNAFYQGVISLAMFASGLSFATVAATLLNAAIALIPIILTALGLAFVLVADDLRRFLNGQDSALERLAEKWAALEGPIGAVGRFILDLRDHGDMAMTLMADDIDFWTQRMGSYFTRMGLRIKLVFSQVQDAILEAENAGARFFGQEVLTEQRINAQGDVATDAIQRQLDAEIAANAAAIAGRQQERIALQTDLAIDAAERRASVNVDASGDTIVQVDARGNSPEETQAAVESALNERDQRRAGDLSRALAVGG